jgi:TfoX/Sxy family transcriptional regulator of competence genes
MVLCGSLSLRCRRNIMASDAGFVQFVVDQLESAGEISSRKMFGDYALYCNKKVVALICDNRLFVKPTDGGRKYIGNVVEAPAYDGAKSSFLIEDKLEDRRWLTGLIRITEREVPEPRPKKKSGRSARGRGKRKLASRKSGA